MLYGVMVALVLAWVGTGWGATKGALTSLRGLAGVEVVVESLDPEAEQDGLHNSQLQTDIELRLRKVGIKVESGPKALNIPGMPTLYVNINTIKKESGSYAYRVDVELQQSVILDRNRSLIIMSATTWNTGMLGMVGSNNMPATVREAVGDLVDKFINDFLAENPVKR